jgi:hypothetical protein
VSHAAEADNADDAAHRDRWDRTPGISNPTRSPGPGSFSPCTTDAILREEFYGTGGSRTSCGTAGQPERAVDACAIVADGLLAKVSYRFKPASGGEPVKALTLSVALTAAAVALAAVARAGTGCGRAR